jgi:threonine synthase
VELAQRTGGAIESVTDDEIRAGIRLLAETTGIFTETAGGVTTAVLAKLAAAGAIDPDERVVAYITGDGLKTLDAVRGTADVTEIAPSLDEFEAAFAPAGVA